MEAGCMRLMMKFDFAIDEKKPYDLDLTTKEGIS